MYLRSWKCISSSKNGRLNGYSIYFWRAIGGNLGPCWHLLTKSITCRARAFRSFTAKQSRFVDLLRMYVAAMTLRKLILTNVCWCRSLCENPLVVQSTSIRLLIGEETFHQNNSNQLPTKKGRTRTISHIFRIGFDCFYLLRELLGPPLLFCTPPTFAPSLFKGTCRTILLEKCDWIPLDILWYSLQWSWHVT